MLRGFPTVSYFDSNSEEYYNGVACFRLHVEKASRLYACLYCLISVSGDFVFGRFFSLSLSLLLIPLLLIGVFKRARTFLLVSIGVAGIGLGLYIFLLGCDTWFIIKIIKAVPSTVKDKDEEDLPKIVFEIVRLLINISFGSYLLHILHCFWGYLTKAEKMQQPFRIDEARLAEMAQKMREIEQKPKRGRKESTKLSKFIERMHYDPFDECAQFLAIFASLRLLHDCFTNLLLFSSSSCFLLTSLFLLQNYRFVWPFQGRQSTHKKASACLSSMLVHSLIHFVIALKSRSIFLDAHILLITFLAWRNQMELHERMQWPTREQRRNAQRG